VEREYDGEYCQIYVGILVSEVKVEVFSKSGRDSTEDRAGTHHTIKQALGIGMS